MPVIDGTLEGKGLKVGIIVSHFNSEITENLLEGAINTLLDNGVRKSNIDTVYVPGVLEIPITAKALANSKNYHGLIAIGAVIKGETSHNLYVSQNGISGINLVSIETKIPITCGILTVDTYVLAESRSSLDENGCNRGAEAAEALLETINVLREIE